MDVRLDVANGAEKYKPQPLVAKSRILLELSRIYLFEDL